MFLALIQNMRIILIFLLINLFYIHPGVGQNDHLAIGNTAFEKGLYQQALDEYKKLENSKLGGFGLYTNIARSYAQLKKDPQAILYYEKALKIKPNHKEIKHELLTIKKRNPELDDISTDFFLIKWWKYVSGIWVSDTWAILSLFILVSAGILYLFGNKLKWYPQYKNYVLSGILGLFIFCTLAAMQRYDDIYQPDHWIIIAPETKLKAGPDDLSPDLAQLPAGTKVRKADVLAQWIQVVSPYGDTGWIKAQSAASL